MKQGWEIKKLGEVCNIIMGQSPSSDTYNDSIGLPFFQGNADFGKISPIVRVFCSSPIRIAYKDDILVSVRAPIGAINIADRECCIGRGLAAIRNNNILITKYIYHVIVANRDKLIAQGTGSTFKSIGRNVIKELSIPVPSREEQERIVGELDCLSGIIENKRAQLRELDAIAQSIFYTMFGSVENNIKGYAIKPLSDVFILIKDGTHQTPQYTDKDNGVKFLSAKDVVSGYINWGNIKYIPYQLHDELYKRVSPQKNDILLCKNGTYGICALVETDDIFDIYVSLALLRPKENYIPKYLVYAINNPFTKRQFDATIKGIGVPNLHLGEIKKTRIIIPPIELQKQFAEKIENIERQKELIKQSIKETEDLFNSRMDYYFN